MRTVGAISLPKSEACVYFCDVLSSEIEMIPLPDALRHLVAESAGRSVMAALESDDELQSITRCVGIMFLDTNGRFTESIHNDFSSFEVDMKQIFEWEYMTTNNISWE